MENKYVAYYRVSTVKQGMSGLGLDSQKMIVSDFIRQNKNVSLLHEFVEVESGKVNNRPALLQAISTSKNTGSILLVAKLDRLSRSVSFISQLMESQVKFTCCDMPEANELTIHIFASLAQWERKRISERTKDALKAKKVREPNWKAGTNNLTDSGRGKAYNTIISNARTDINVRHALHYITGLKESGHTYQFIANALNDEGYKTRNGCMFHPTQVRNILYRFMNELVTNGIQNETI